MEAKDLQYEEDTTGVVYSMLFYIKIKWQIINSISLTQIIEKIRQTQ